MKRTSSGGVGTSKLGAFLKMLWLVLVVRKSTRAFYDSIGDGYDTLVGGQPDSEDACDFLEDYATEQGVELRSVLEAGCGTGLYSRHLEGICDELHGLDYSRGQLDQARRKGLRMSVALGDSGALPYRAETFDAVTSFELLAHLPSREAEYFEEAYRVLRPGGISLPDPNTPFRRSNSLAGRLSWTAGRVMRKALIRLSNIESWLEIPTPDYLIEQLEKAGFEARICARSHAKTWPFLVARKTKSA